MPNLSNLASAATLTDEQIASLCAYHCTQNKDKNFENIRKGCADLLKIIFDNAPQCSARTRAINAVLDARMLANQAIALEKE